MTYLSVAFVAVSLLSGSAHPSAAQTIYRWQDSEGGLHYSNQVARTQGAATAVELPPIGSIGGPVGTQPRQRRSSTPRSGGSPSASPCGPADSTALTQAISSEVAIASPDARLTLLVGGIPFSTSPDANVQSLVTSWDPDAPQGHLSQSAIAYPVGASCPTSPPLVRYATNGRREAGSKGLCDDYRRAFAQVGVAASRDAGIARSFGEIANDFIRVAQESNVATASGFRTELTAGMFTSDATQLAPYMTIPLSPWIVAAHVSQTSSLAVQSSELVEQLTVALEEIDRAARATGCWN